MVNVLLFFIGAFTANSVPHFVNGISGKECCIPFLYRYVEFIPPSLFNVCWGMLNIAAALALLSVYRKSAAVPVFHIGLNTGFLIFCSGFIFASVFLSLFFRKGGWRR